MDEWWWDRGAHDAGEFHGRPGGNTRELRGRPVALRADADELRGTVARSAAGQYGSRLPEGTTSTSGHRRLKTKTFYRHVGPINQMLQSTCHIWALTRVMDPNETQIEIKDCDDTL
jgi:hypothetical protein